MTTIYYDLFRIASSSVNVNLHILHFFKNRLILLIFLLFFLLI